MCCIVGRPLTNGGKPGVDLPGYVAQDGREGTAVGLGDVALCCYRRVRFVGPEQGPQRGVDIVSHARYASNESRRVVPLDVVVDVTNLWESAQTR